MTARSDSDHVPFSTAIGHYGWRRVLAVISLVGAAACGQGSAPPPGGAAAGQGAPPPAMPVEVITLAPKPVENLTEFVGTIKSRHSITIQPQVEGFLTRIAVKSGDRVAKGAVLMEIDAMSQQAAVASLESTHAARESDAAYAHQQATRAKSMLDIGAGSQQEYEQAVAAEKSAAAQVKALEGQVRQQRNELGYYQVTAPEAGVIGDIPARQGDRVTRTTVLTTLDDNSALELYLNVPVQQASDLKLGLPVRLVTDAGETIATVRITFVATSVDDETQTILTKSALADSARTWRPDQFVRARIVWSSAPGLTVPVVAVNRINGQYFVFVAEDAAQGAVAKQRPVSLGAVVGNDYVLVGGLKAGEKLIVSGVQKIGDGMPVHPTPAAAPAAAPAPAKKSRVDSEHLTPRARASIVRVQVEVLDAQLIESAS